MNHQEKTKEELIKILQELEQENKSLKELFEKDVFERMSVEEKLHDSEIKHRILFENAGDAIFIHEANSSKMLAVNKLACERLGYTYEELMSMPTSAVDTLEQSKYVPERIAQLMTQGYITFETEHQCKDGSIVPTEVNAKQIIWDGVPVIMSICRDITKRKLVEVKLKENEERFRILTEQSPIAIEYYNLDGLLINANPACLELFGIVDVNEISQFSLFDFLYYSYSS